MIDTSALREKVLDLAIRGKLVPQDPNDEPASVLLERIRAEKEQMVKDGKLKAKDIKNDTIIFKGEDNLHYEKFSDGTVKCIEDEIPFDVPDGWAWARLSSISEEIFAGGDKPENLSKIKTEKMKYPIFSNGVENNGLYGYTDIPRVTKPSVTVSARGTIGFCCVRKEPFFPIIRLITIIPFSNIETTFLSYIFKAMLETGKGSSIPQLTVPDVKPKLLPIPPQKEQERISSSIEKILCFTNYIDEQHQDVVELCSAIKSKILDLAIRGKLVPQNKDDEPASVLLERIKAEKEELIKQGKIKRDKKESVIFKGDDNSYYEKIGDNISCIDDEIPFDLPDEIEFVRFKNLWELLSGRDLERDEYNSDKVGIPYITGASNFNNGHIEISRWTSAPQVITQDGDLLLTCKGTVGEMAINTFGDAHIARQVMGMRNVYGLNIEYLSLCISFYIDKIKKSAKGLIPGISREDVLNLILPVPSEQYQKDVVERVVALFDYINIIEKSLS